MFTTGIHSYLYTAAGCYGLSFLFSFFSRRIPLGLLVVGVVCHILYVVGRGWLAGVFIPNAIFEGPFFLPVCLALIALGLLLKKPTVNWAALLALISIFTALSVCYTKGIIPPTPKKTSVWALGFFISESIAHSLFYVGALFAFFTIRGKAVAGGCHSWIIWGFIFYTIAQVTGALWCFLGWGNTFSWGARHLSSAAVWIFFAGCLHLQFIPRWRKKTAVFIIIGAGLVFFISYGHYLHEMSFPRIGG